MKRIIISIPIFVALYFISAILISSIVGGPITFWQNKEMLLGPISIVGWIILFFKSATEPNAGILLVFGILALAFLIFLGFLSYWIAKKIFPEN